VTLGSIVNAAGNGVGNIGSSSGYFNTVFAKATSAQYADVAERFASDTTYPAGTVVELGGIAEITVSLTELSENVFGVISTQAAYLMNSAAGTDETHPPIAMTGRVPVRVVGMVRKGDRLVSAGFGLARSAKPGEASAFNVIGRSLEDKLDINEGTVEAIVATK
jgi:enamine deaminase RidA (YjgF/YER057c/UK114 family)